LLSPKLLSKLPLRNLHWKSPSRPLRSIDSLHIDFVPSRDTASDTLPAASVLPDATTGVGGSLSRSTSVSSHRPGSSAGENLKSSGKERRHQIPGLRQNPYLKLYLLRCDDGDTYKATSRKQIREWLRLNTSSQSSTVNNAQENHDAFEWMILHVVLPDTPAASQPRWTGTSAASSSTSVDKPSSTSRWPGRSSSTIFEKIRADFNVSSKSAPDRVAQVRLAKDNSTPGQSTTASSVVTSTSDSIESTQEQENAWNDLIAKFKILILMSFDLRVSQYEEDIREKDTQRVLPGWNFCTFFLLKEGLALGFENVGLVEDALIGYDELSIGLESVVREQAVEGHADFGGSFLEYTEDLADYVRALKDNPEAHAITSWNTKPIDSRTKPYRDLILQNKISIFDFKCYIFSRQMSLLLRLGNARSSRAELMSKLPPERASSLPQRPRDDINLPQLSDAGLDTAEDLMSLAEICDRTLTFITIVARDLRADLQKRFVKSYFRQENNSNSWNRTISNQIELPESIIDNLVSSWTYSVAAQILSETSTHTLPISLSRKGDESNSGSKLRTPGNNLVESKVVITEPKTIIHPARSSSLVHRRASQPSLQDPPYATVPGSGQVVYDHGNFRAPDLPGQDTQLSKVVDGLKELAAHRANLYLVQRRALEHLGAFQQWFIGWKGVSASSPSPQQTTDIPLDEDSKDIETETSGSDAVHSYSTKGLTTTELQEAMQDLDAFRKLYERLSDYAVRHYLFANMTKSVEGVMGDLAALKFQSEDFAGAAMYFSQMAQTFAHDRWGFVEMAMLKMYADCLKNLDRRKDLVGVLLDIVAKSCSKLRSDRATDRTTLIKQSDIWLDDDCFDPTGFLTELLQQLQKSEADVIVPMSKYFTDIHIEPYLRHYSDKDGFQLLLKFRHLLPDTITADKVQARIISTSASQVREIWLHTNEQVQIKRGNTRVWLDTNVRIY
jgi:trafficking protein particle complex subunit 10